MILCQVNRVLFRQNCAVQLFRYIHNDNVVKVLHPLKSRNLLEVSGEDSVEFLQGLITNDMRHLQDGAESMYAMFLNNKGRVLYDTLIHKWSNSNRYMLECDKTIIGLLKKHLNLYKIRRKVEINDVSAQYKLWALTFKPSKTISPEVDIHRNIVFYQDPRLPELGYRVITASNVDVSDIKEWTGKDTVIESNENIYKELRFSLGVSEGAEDLSPGSCLPLEANCDYLHGVSFHKGCYIGQELTARVHHTGVVRKRIMPIKFKQDIIEDIQKDASIMNTADNKSTAIGKFKNYTNSYGIGLVRIKEALEGTELFIGKYPIEIMKPSWWPLEAPKEKVPIINRTEEKQELETAPSTDQPVLKV